MSPQARHFIVLMAEPYPGDRDANHSVSNFTRWVEVRSRTIGLPRRES
jgi:hypothetical protein